MHRRHQLRAQKLRRHHRILRPHREIIANGQHREIDVIALAINFISRFSPVSPE